MSLLWRIKAHCRHVGLPPTKFGRLAINDPRLVGDMERGRRIGPEVRARVEAFMRGARP